MTGPEYAITYLVIGKSYSSHQQEGRGQKVVSATAKPPSSVPAGAVVVRLRIAVPSQAFRPLSLDLDVPVRDESLVDAQSSLLVVLEDVVPEDES